MSRAQTYAANVSRLLDNLGKAGRLSLAALTLRLPPVVAVRWSHSGESLRIGKDWYKGASDTVYKRYPACTRIRIEGQGAITATLTFFYQGYGDVTVHVRQSTGGNSVISFPVPLPDGWRYPDAAGRLTNMSRVGDFT